MLKIATRLKDVEMRGEASLYHVDPPIKNLYGQDHYYVIVSAVMVPREGPETYIFPALGPESTEPSEWVELEGSFKGGWSHEIALEGYDILDLRNKREIS